ncbi:hypothetical protein AcV5_004688 [Taiwanofungus camphoratus]|nr:hypothetical protein AcW2_000710 [Antrodia cinnamomea]KAI0936591.1 hypothetical protein AcV5_004688 [Antrodia cinnamomea]
MAENRAADQPQVDDEDRSDVDQEAHIQSCLKEAEELKLEGNEYFREKRWEEALNAYRTGLGRLPKRKESLRQNELRNDKGKGKGREDDTSTEEARDAAEETGTSQDGPVEAEAAKVPLTGLEAECSKARSIINANIGACYVKLGDHKEAVEACTQALLDDPQYIKALQRRAASNEQLNTWSSLSSAQEDYNTLLKLLPPSSPSIPQVKRSLHSLKPRVEEAQKRETAEMMDKLKGLGNNILGKFGLSTDNFQFVPNGQGGYSMNFVK